MSAHDTDIWGSLMHRRAIVLTLASLAVVLWVGLAVFMNRRLPDAANQAIFLLIWGAAVSCTVIPSAFAISARLTRSLVDEGDLSDAIRRGVIAGLVAIGLMALRFLRLLTLPIGIILVLVALALELLISLRNR